MRILTLLALSCVALSSHTARATPLPTLCTAEEHVLISGETPRGFASLCAGKNDVWHYRFGEPGHVTYVFPRDNSPTKKNFSSDILDYKRNQGGSIFAFRDHGREIYIFDAITTAWGDQRNIIGTVAGVRIKDPKRHKAIDLPFTRRTPGGETSWMVNRTLPFTSAVTINMANAVTDSRIFEIEKEPFNKNYSEDTSYFIYDFSPRLIKYPFPSDEHPYQNIDSYVDDTPFSVFSLYQEFEKTFLIFTQQSALRSATTQLIHRAPTTLCTDTEKIIVSGRTAQGDYASICAVGVHWQYRFGQPGHLTYRTPYNNAPARDHFSYARIKPYENTSFKLSIDDGTYFYFKNDNILISFFTSYNRQENSPIKTLGMVTERKNNTVTYSIPIVIVDYDSTAFTYSMSLGEPVFHLPNSILTLEPQYITSLAPVTLSPSALALYQYSRKASQNVPTSLSSPTQ